jgi:hypothetical protein
LSSSPTCPATQSVSVRGVAIESTGQALSVIVNFFQEPADTVAGRILDLHRRHAREVCDVFDDAIRMNAAKMRDGSLPADCLISLVVGQGAGDHPDYAPSRAVEPLASPPPREIRMSIDEGSKRVMFERWGEIGGIGAELLIALAAPFREATQKERAPEQYPFLETSKLTHQLRCDDELLRRRVLRARNAVKKLAINAGDLEPPMNAVIESSQWHGYRLNPDRVRLVALSC